MAAPAKGIRLGNLAPSTHTAEGGDIIKWAEKEMDDLRQQLNAPSEVRLEPRYVAPQRPRAGMVVYADGVRWNPGGGEGIYYYKSTGAWILIG